MGTWTATASVREERCVEPLPAPWGEVIFGASGDLSLLRRAVGMESGWSLLAADVRACGPP